MISFNFLNLLIPLWGFQGKTPSPRLRQELWREARRGGDGEWGQCLEEEEVVRELLWTLVNNHVFFQHPDLIRILKIHENVIAIMMNSIARSEGGGGGGGEGEVIITNMENYFSPSS